MYNPNTLFTKSQATELINEIVRREAAFCGEQDAGMYTRMLSATFRADEWDNLSAIDDIEQFIDMRSIPCISLADIYEKLNAWKESAR